MFLGYFSYFLLALVAGINCKTIKSKGSQDDFSWPEKYSFEITKYSILSGLAEDIKIWHSGDQSRADSNGGAVKNFVTSGSSRHSRGFSYEIHPETQSEDEVNKIVCHRMRRSRFSESAVDVLPEIEGFENIGTEEMHDQECTVLYLDSTDENIERKETVWIYHDHHADGWVPVRYEVQEYNSYIGSIDRHELIEYEAFNASFSEKIFDPSEYCDEENRAPIRHTENDEAVTKHLHFINPENEKHVNHVFKHFKKHYNKKYAHKKEHDMRKSVFKKNLRMIRSTNLKNLHYKLAVNKFSDRTPEEMKRYMGLLRRPEGKRGQEFPYTEDKVQAVQPQLPAEFDLRVEGVISPIKDQGECGSCWTFGTTSAVEGALARSNGRMINLSNQALVDCAWETGNFGCEGGFDVAAYEWIEKYGLPTIADYGNYKNSDGYCNIQNMTKTFKIKGFVDVTPINVGALKVALINHGPLSVSVHVTPAFAAYRSGVFYDFECDPTQLNHEITLVGYGQEYGEDYWIVKNSWGPEWGIDGYMHIAAKDNNCGIMTEPTYVII